MKTNLPKITVVTPSYNQGMFIERTILSIIGQNYPNMEYIVCDGGSTDETVEILKKYDKDITWWCSEKDKGQTDAINKGMKRATGDIVGWINSDDVLLPGALWAIAYFYIKHPEVEFANGYTAEIDKDDRMTNFMTIIMSKTFARRGCYNISQLGMFWKRTLFDKLGYLDETFHATMDVEWLVRVYESGACVKRINENIGAIRCYELTKTAQGGEIWVRDRMEMLKRYNGMYTAQNRTRFIYMLFQIRKFLDGCLFRNRWYKRKYVGKKVTEYTENLRYCKLLG